MGNTKYTRLLDRSATVHPHSRGEHYLKAKRLRPSDGSSPLAWGTQRGKRGDVDERRFIPTRVGNTNAVRGDTIYVAVHPHSRGEHLHAHIQRHARARFIPNRVGNTCSCTSRPTSPTVHPHSRGEHLSAATTNQQLSGSSPLAWGTRSACPTHRTQSRFIPTRVGNTQAESVGAPPRPVHPHSRGEHASRTESAILLAGSSPLAWGTLAGADSPATIGRFIPTRVGNTLLLAHCFTMQIYRP